MKTTTNPAQEYAELIALELYDLDHAANGVPYGFQPDEPETDDELAAEYRQALTNLEMPHDTENPFYVWINETALDVAILRDTRGGNYAYRIEILRTCGGPTCYIIHDANDLDRLQVEVSDGTHKYTKTVYSESICNYLDEMGYAQ